MRKHKSRHAIGQRRLTNSWLTADQPGMRHTAATIAVEKFAFRIVVAEQHAGFARVADFTVVAIGQGSALTGAGAGMPTPNFVLIAVHI